MEGIFRNVRILDPNSKHHQQIRDVWVKDGEIVEIKAKISTSKKVKSYQSPNACLSPGWIDLGCLGGEPGNEHRETLNTLSQAAVRGGYTTVCCLPNTRPVLHSKSEIAFIRNKSENLPVNVYPIGAVSKDCKSEEMAEILQMKEAGAIAFSDGKVPIQKSGLLMRALEYMKLVPDRILINSCQDQGLAGHGQMHEGKTSTSLGLKGIPVIAETVNIQRDLAILDYSQSRMLIHKLSSASSVELLREAKNRKQQVYSSVSIFNLVFEDHHLEQLNVHLKLDPPLRSASDRKALISGLRDGTIDLICSDHTAWDPEKKDLEFQAAAFGSISLETAFAAYCTHLSKDLDAELWVEKVAVNPARILGLPESGIQVGQTMDLTWFDPSLPWTYNGDSVRSLSKNSPFLNQELKGRALGIWSKRQFHPC
ncbi:MAG TPA: dihydroorotase [Saprospiraceae bacterium]|nr:dihydroorotase [Saprospiraceae bacterium]